MKITLQGPKKYNFDALCQACVQVLKNKVNLQSNLTVEVVFLSAGAIKKLNNRTRQIDKATDVLSYPAIENLKEQEIALKNFAGDGDGLGGIFIGSIAICKPILKKQAKEFGHSKIRELNYLTTHGILHLLGYDHLQPEDKAQMREIEEEILNLAGFTR